ncbi:tRNA (guanine(10)-N(2))-methyltransferase [Malassezia vespertilionis]|uniref:tRNA (guanine(10)-N(2))-methyltransferase n=1 Tax=Malassezia vespertilionis TaxID=2020962 RepID=A0A2N1JGX8_9BASI|nr:tRNA (guanine(10)-N(2))-methyltransferase [Malassezia vespertilionis]PKI85802.1 hypothetical protein MVES_000634 [Malassezia vespertilionis]WFD05351.1 tRNA (guanine(10)-N(2))-methyltransferase [Malassezia vespertilionis]
MQQGTVYILHFAQSNIEFRVPEFDACASYLSIPYEFLPTPARPGMGAASAHDARRPFMLCRLPNDGAVQALMRRCSCLRAGWELWACADTYGELHSRNKAAKCYEKWLPATYTWKALMQGFNAAISNARRLDLINSFSYMKFEGEIRMKGSDITWGVLEEYARVPLGTTQKGPKEAIGDTDPRLVELFLGRKIKDRSGALPARDLIDQLSLKKRKYIGNTSMESEMSVIMANMAQVGPAKLIYDPFAGTGSMLYACSMLGAMSFGSDIDGRMLRGRNEDCTGLALAAEQYGIRGRIVDGAVFDITQSPWRLPFRAGGGGIFDAIVTDPPYGVRAGAKRLGKRDITQQRDEPFIMADGTPAHVLPDYLPPTKPYHLSELVHDLLEYSSALLTPGGRLVFWLPTMNEDNAETTIPKHPHFVLIAHSLQDFGRWGRRLITLEKVRNAPIASIPQAPAAVEGRVRASDNPSEFRNRLFQRRDARS